jgi:hypothetical protein
MEGTVHGRKGFGNRNPPKEPKKTAGFTDFNHSFSHGWYQELQSSAESNESAHVFSL